MTAPAALAARGLTRRFGRATALQGFDLTLPAGEALTLLGRNGAGKTTLLKLAAGLLRPTEGSIEVFGLDPRRVSAGARARIGYLGHRMHLYDDLTARENLSFTAAIYGLPDPEARVMQALSRVGLLDRTDDPVRTLSRGLQQRVALARTLLPGPSLLLLDEPTTGLDRESSGLLVEAVREAVRQGAAVMMATHDLEAGLAASPRWLLLDRGRPVRSGDGARGERP